MDGFGLLKIEFGLVKKSTYRDNKGENKSESATQSYSQLVTKLLTTLGLSEGVQWRLRR